MDAIVLDGFLDAETVPGDLHGTTARFRLTVSPTDERADEMILPCGVSDPWLVHAVLHDLEPGDQIRVTGCLQLPRTPDGVMWLQVDAIEDLAAVPLNAAGDAADLNPLEDGVGLSDGGFIERYGPYVAYHDPELAETSIWTEAGPWVGTVEDVAAIGELISGYERRTAAGET